MPHILIDYTANLAAAVEEGQVVDRIHQAAVDSGIFPVWGIRTMARPVAQYRVGNGDADNGFIHVSVRIGPGRDLVLRQRVVRELFAAVMQVLEPLYATQRLGCQLEVTEFDASMVAYRNNLAIGHDPAEPRVTRPESA